MDRVLQAALEKFALTRSVKEWRIANAAGNTQQTSQIAPVPQPAMRAPRPAVQTLPTVPSPKMASIRSSFLNELQKIAEAAKSEKKPPTGPKAMKVYREIAKQYPELVQPKQASATAEATEHAGRRLAKWLHHHEDHLDAAGLGVLGTIGADRIQAHLRAGNGATDQDVEHKQLLGETGHAVLDTAGLGILAAAPAAKLLHR